MSDIPPEPWSVARTAEHVTYSELVLQTEQRAAIGCVAVESARLEDMVEHLVWLLLKVDDKRGKAVTGEMMWSHKYGMLQRLVGAEGGQMAADFAPLKKRISDAMAARRQIIHGYWELPPDQPIQNYLRVMFGVEKPNPGMEAFSKYRDASPLKAADVIDTAKELSLLQLDLGQFLIKHIPFP